MFIIQLMYSTAQLCLYVCTTAGQAMDIIIYDTLPVITSQRSQCQQVETQWSMYNTLGETKAGNKPCVKTILKGA